MQKVCSILILLLISWISNAQTITIMIDPGHGGSDPGHESLNEDLLQEKDLNLLIAKKFGDYLSEKLANVTVIYTRTDDTFPTLDERVELANDKKVDYFISIHCNGSPNANIHGTESHVHTMTGKKSVKLAREFENQFSAKAGRKSRGVKDTDDREHSLRVLKCTAMTSVLVECGFLTNKKEALYLNTDYGRELIASALFRGMRTFLQSEHPAIDFSKKPETATASKTEDKGDYTVQIMSSKDPLELTTPAFKKLDKPVLREQTGSTGYKYRYTVGRFDKQSEAERCRDEARKKGFPDAIIIRKKKS